MSILLISDYTLRLLRKLVKQNFQAASNEVISRNFWAVLDLEKLHISCHCTPLPKSYDLMDKPSPRIRSVCYWLKCCIGARFSKTRRKKSPNVAVSARSNSDFHKLGPCRSYSRRSVRRIPNYSPGKKYGDLIQSIRSPEPETKAVSNPGDERITGLTWNIESWPRRRRTNRGSPHPS